MKGKLFNFRSVPDPPKMNGSQPSEDRTAEQWLIGEARAFKRPLLISFAASLLAGLLAVAQARALAWACHRVVIEKSDISPVIPLSVAVLLLALSRSLLFYFSEKSASSAAAELKQRVRSRLYRQILSSGSAGHAGESATLVEAATVGVDSLELYFTRFLPQLALAATLPPLILFFTVPAEWRASLVLLFSAPFIPLLMILVGKGTQSLNRRQWSRLARLSGHLTDLLQGLPDLKICSAVKREADAVARLSEEYRHSTMAVLRVAFLSAFTLEFFSTVGTAVVAVITGFRLLSGHLQLVDGLFILLLAPEFYLPLRTLGLSYHSRMQGIAAAEQIFPLLVADDRAGDEPGYLPVPPGKLSIAYEGVTFRYKSARGGITSVDLCLIPGEITALVGASGAGKSTLAGLLLALAHPQEGRLTVNGTDLKSIDPKLWQSRIAMVPQSPFFFSGTIRENIAIGLFGCDDASIKRALLSSSALEFVEKLPLGLNSQLGDRGAGLSGGELRRLALARVFLRNPDLIILDEPTAGLDSENEQLVCKALRLLAEERTILLISHREDTVSWADRVVRISDGRIDNAEIPYA
jgi:ATP-binding cassette subfamily C protein CydD